MNQTTSDLLLRRLREWGVSRVFGYPGDGINGLMGAFERFKGEIEFIQVRHEESAAFMACAHAKFTAEPGVCVATSGPGAIHLLNGLYDAKCDRQPVVAIVGQAARSAIGGNYQQEVDLQSLFKDVANEFVFTAMSPLQIRHLVDRSMRIARSERCVTCIIIPKDVQDQKGVGAPPHAHNTVHSSAAFSRPRIVPTEADLRRAADILNGSERVAMLVGAGAREAAGEAIAVADILGAGVAKALLGKDVLPDDLPFVTGCIGLLGTAPSSYMMDHCDALLMCGTSFPYAEFLPREGRARGIQIDIDGRMLGIRYPTELNLQGDCAETLRALAPLLERKPTRAWRADIEKRGDAWWRLMEARASESADPVNPERVFFELSKRLPGGCIITGDAGTATNWFARQLRMRRGMRASLSGSLATMGSAVPYAIAAKFAFPDRPVLAVTGDGAMQMNGLNELLTVAKYRHRWSDQRLVFLVLNNRELSQVSWEMRVAGEPKFPDSQDLPDFPYARFAESIGLAGLSIESDGEISAAWDEAFSSGRPVVVEARTDPDVATLPPHITFEQARGFLTTLAKGDPDQTGLVEQAIKGVLASISSLRGRGRDA
jgi:pyruvate dehydrogenase (quinone)